MLPPAFFIVGLCVAFCQGIQSEESDRDFAHSRQERQFTDTRNFITPFELRLVNGSNSSEGRVEVKYNDEWGTVCVQLVGNTNRYIYIARVVCKQLGFADAVEAKPASFYGPGSGTVLLSPTCYGDEPLLDKCKLVWQNQLNDNCNSHNNDLGVVCTDTPMPKLRLVGGSKPTEGRVEVLYNGQWGTVCGQGATFNVGVVACRQLGYREALQVYNNASVYGEGTGAVWMKPANGCSKNKKSALLEDCVLLQRRHKWNNTGCTHADDLGVVCTDTVPVRLANGSGRHEGRIEVYHEGKWGTVCTQNQDKDMATVICGQLGFNGVDRMVLNNNRFGPGVGPVWLRPKCIGNETHLGHCSFFKWGVYDWWCNHDHDIGVICANETIVRTLAPLAAAEDSCKQQPVTLGVVITVLVVCVAVAVAVSVFSLFYLCRLKQNIGGFSSYKFDNEPGVEIHSADLNVYEKDCRYGIEFQSDGPDFGTELYESNA